MGVSMYDDLYDVIVIGAGAAGLTAATMLGRSMRSTLVISQPRRRNSPASSVNNVPYADGAAPADIYRKMEQDAGRYGVTLLWDEVTSVRAYEDHVVVEGGANPGLRCRRLLLATGPRRRPAGLAAGRCLGQIGLRLPLLPHVRT
ncbi:hypothetical protein SM007_35700 [Streptomyces avermitilis]|uniref:FAD-dependent oxidoreductase n=1 Tax=Streptomyces avermitilis TaxID=33903 RepID=UPI00099274DF|nr:FAD-dependent oxidoreductase [Streptomyces avermitilis]OOV20943.1 hypothetical protein SM007_35700 [Streptomyces avermitilis]